MTIVVMGVSGSGKSTVGALLAERLDVPFCEGDDLHPAANVAKMAAGHPLTDRDRAPWLAAIADWIAAHPAGVVSCSALKRRYRDRLRLAGDVAFVWLDPPRPALATRLHDRSGHFMPATLLDSQFEALERPIAAEHVLRLSGRGAPDALAERAVRWLASASDAASPDAGRDRHANNRAE